MKTIILLIAVHLIYIYPVSGQADLSQPISLEYSETPLSEILEDISTFYGVNFSYSSDFISVDQKVSIKKTNAPLGEVLKSLFESTKIVYASIGDHIVLRTDDSRLTSNENTLRDESPELKKTDIEEATNPDSLQIGVNTPSNQNAEGEQSNNLPENEEEYFEPQMEYRHTTNFRTKPDPHFFRLTLVPGISTGSGLADSTEHGISVNILAGRSYGIHGFEFGFLLNNVINDVRGMQLGGLANFVGGDVSGGQVSGIYNFTKGDISGMQMAGCLNTSKNVRGGQIAGLVNIVPGQVNGVQVSGIANFVEKNADVQLTGMFNISQTSRIQVAGLVNYADKIQGGQIAGLVNIARKVNGFQIGLINIADTITGPPIGLLNIVRKGYNRVELAGSTTLHGMLALKMGGHRFYNIIQFGGRLEDIPQSSDYDVSWALGYGLGTMIPLSDRLNLNMEVASMHVNEREPWTNELNLLNQFRLNLDINLGTKTSLFLGPVYNVMVSKLYDRETGRAGSRIAPYTFYNHTDYGAGDPVNVQMWIGFAGGLRF